MLRRHLQFCLSWASCPSGCCVASPHAAASHLLASLPLICHHLLLHHGLLCLFSSSLLRLLSSCCRLPSDGAHPLIAVAWPLLTLHCPLPFCLSWASCLASCCVASPLMPHSIPLFLAPLVWLIVASPLLMLLPPICWRLSSRHCLLLCYGLPCLLSGWFWHCLSLRPLSYQGATAAASIFCVHPPLPLPLLPPPTPVQSIPLTGACGVPLLSPKTMPAGPLLWRMQQLPLHHCVPHCFTQFYIVLHSFT
jgi:hypothetical protein